MERTFKTHLIWHDSIGNERNCDATVTYVGTNGYPPSLEEPGEPDSVEILSVVDTDGADLPDHFLTDEWLIAECHEHWEADVEAAAEYRAEARREAHLLGDD